MKKIILSLLLVGMLFGFTQNIKAEITPQMVQSAQQSPELKAQLIQLILQMIASLQAQINQILAQQAVSTVPVVTPITVPELVATCKGSLTANTQSHYTIDYKVVASGGYNKDYYYYWVPSGACTGFSDGNGVSYPNCSGWTLDNTYTFKGDGVPNPSKLIDNSNITVIVKSSSIEFNTSPKIIKLHCSVY